jgi:hypothetical protein
MLSNQISRRKLLVLSTLALPVWSEAKAVDPKSFEVQVKNGVRIINDWKYLKQDNEGLWQKQWLLIREIKYDVVKSESALRPFIGTLQALVVSMFSTKQQTRAEAEAGQIIEEAPRVPGGKNAYTLEYDLKFEPTATEWLFLEGKARTSLQLMVGRDDWTELSVEEMRDGGGMHGHIVRAFATKAPSRCGSGHRSPAISPHTTQRINTKGCT